MPVDIAIPSALDDVFLHDLPLPHSASFYPLGFPVRLATNSQAILAAARQSWDSFSLEYPETPVSLSLAVTEHDDDRLPPSPKFRAHQQLMSIVADAHNHVICDFARSCACGWVTPRVAGRPDFLRLHFLEPAAMTVLVAAHLAPIHAALVTRDGVGLALCGDSLAGKSTLAYACARSGWTFVSDDGTFLLRNRPDRFAVGNSSGIRFRADAKILFPELSSCRVATRHNGALGMEVRTSQLPVATARGCAIDHFVFLRRSASGPAHLDPFNAAEALRCFQRNVLYGPPEVQESQRRTYSRLLDAGLWELHYSNLSGAVHALSQLGAAA